MNIKCCKNCLDRNAECHAHCERYQLEVKERAGLKARLDIQRKLDQYDGEMWRNRRRLW